MPVSSRSATLLLTWLAMLAFAGNSLLCRLALATTGIDAGSFTLLRLASGALVLVLLVRGRDGIWPRAGSWAGAAALFVYAAAFSFAYLGLTTATGALCLFGAVQASMIGYGLWQGERLAARQWLGFVCALAGLLVLLLPGVAAPPLANMTLMLLAGVAWGGYSLLGRRAGDATQVTAGNFARAVPLAAALCLLFPPHAALPWAGVVYALASGALASGIGYAIWYTALRDLAAATAATVQLSVPLLAALAGWLFLGEALHLRTLLAAVAIVGGIALVIAGRWR
ncbi:DMT family transporter [Vogesella sp. LIG4]|uniref:DMT family transporter n=1 Tax=Vogesella sp. LIG4 TaxID=1192162 RepID=UPI0008200E12|nr:DMT family transporter [Vogesella sp. LIG4]SCK11568.1 Threonine/homoserine efflux transporter RhtA [Vogesella sp. LIG4]